MDVLRGEEGEGHRGDLGMKGMGNVHSAGGPILGLRLKGPGEHVRELQRSPLCRYAFSNDCKTAQNSFLRNKPRQAGGPETEILDSAGLLSRQHDL